MATVIAEVAAAVATAAAIEPRAGGTVAVVAAATPALRMRRMS